MVLIILLKVIALSQCDMNAKVQTITNVMEKALDQLSENGRHPVSLFFLTTNETSNILVESAKELASKFVSKSNDFQIS